MVDKNIPTFDTPTEQYNYYAGLAAGICYMPNDFEALKNKPQQTTLNRAEMTKTGGHHSVFEHSYVSLYLENIPKIFAMLLNNEKVYVTSEKSARYTQMKPTEEELRLYNKWLEIFKDRITKKYGDQQYCDEKRILKLAQENARYLLSVYTPTNMLYSVSYRQLNYMYHWMQNLDYSKNAVLRNLEPYVVDFCNAVRELNLIDEKLANDQKGRTFSLFTDRVGTPYYGDVYNTSYDGSFAMLAQAQRHRTINMAMKYNPDDKFYIPKILREDTTLVEEWMSDMLKVKENIPQGKLITIVERGTPEDLILKAKERLCTCAQLEINDQTKLTIQNYIDNCMDPALVELMKKYDLGARCTFPDYKCNNPCNFAPGVKMDREI